MFEMWKNIIFFTFIFYQTFKWSLRYYTSKHDKIYSSIKSVNYMALINI